MYLVARQGDIHAKDPLIQAEDFTKNKHFAKLITKDINFSHKNNILTHKNSNNGLTQLLADLPSSEKIDLQSSKIGPDFSPEGEKITIIPEDGLKTDYRYDAIFEVEFFEHKDDFFKSVDDLLNAGGVYVCTFMIYQEGQLKKKLLNFMLKGYEMRLEAQKIGYTVLPFIRLVVKKSQFVESEEMGEDGLEEVVQKTKYITVQVDDTEEKEFDLVRTIAILKEFMLSNTHSFGNIYPGRKVTYDIFVPDMDKDRPKYTVHFFDSMNEEFNKNDTYACFIVPEGYEELSLYRTAQGNQQLADMMRVSRLALVIFVPGSPSQTLKEIQTELQSVILERKPASLIGGKIPFLTDGEFHSMRKIVHRDEEIIVEDYLGPGGIEFYRRLLFIKNFKRVQAEIRLIDVDDDESIPRDQIQWGMYSKMEGKTVAKAIETLDSATQRAIFTAYALFRDQGLHQDLTIFGFGVGLLGDFIKHYSSDIHVTGVDISQSALDAAKKYFFLKHDFNLVTKDAFAYAEAADENSIDVLIVDLDSTELIKNKRDLVPKGKFREDSFFKLVSRIVKETGYTVFTIIHNSDEDQRGFEKVISKHFETILRGSALSDDQTVYILSQTSMDFDAVQSRLKINYQARILDVFSKKDLEEHDFADISQGLEIVKLGQNPVENLGKLINIE